MDISLSSGGEVKVNVIYKDRVPDLLSQFSKEVQRRARRFLHWPSAYERKVWRATKGMPRWARETVRQHILHERADAIHRRLQTMADKREQRARARAAVMSATRQVVSSVPAVVETAKRLMTPVQQRSVDTPRVSTRDAVSASARDVVPAPNAEPTMPRLGAARQASGSAWSAPTPTRRTLTERLAQEHGVEPAWPRDARNVQDHSRGR